MRKIAVAQTLILVCGLAVAHAAAAMPVVWNLFGTFADGGTATGSFTFEFVVTTPTYDDISIRTTNPDPIIPDINYVTSNFQFGDAITLVLGTTVSALALTYPSGLGDPSMPVNIPFAFELVGSAEPRDLTGQLVAGGTESVPEPTTLLLLGIGLAAVGFARRRLR